MKSAKAPLAFATTALAARYPAGAICHTSQECNKNCLDADWTVSNADGDYVLTCANKEYTTQYYAVGGELRGLGCFFSAKKSAEQDVRNKWSDVCNESSKVLADANMTDSRRHAFCKST